MKGDQADLLGEENAQLFLRRILDNSTDQSFIDSVGVSIGSIIGVIYAFAFIYYISIKFYNIIVEDLVYLVNYKEEEEKEIYRSIVYCILHSIPVFVYSISSVVSSGYDSGIMLVFGTDIFNMCAVFGLLLILVILPDKNEGSDIDFWQLIRDSIWYIVGVGIFILFINFSLIAWWSAILMILYYFVYLMILSYNEQIRDSVLLMVGLKHEDDSFNAEEQGKQLKRRIDINELSFKKLIDRSDEQLQKKIMRMDALLKVKFKDELKKKEVFSKWQVAVYLVMFGIRNKHKEEKSQRSLDYAKLFAPSPQEVSMPSENESEQQDIENKQEDEEEGQLINRGNIQLNGTGENPRVISPELGGGLSERRIREIANENQSDKDVKPPSILNEDPQANIMDGNNYEAESNIQQANDDLKVDLGFPTGLINRISYVLFFPIHFIIFLLPNYRIKPSHRKLALSFLINITLLVIAVVILQYLLDNLCNYFGGHNAAYAVSLTSIFLQLPFLKGNYLFARDEKDPTDFLLTFIQLGIFKTGIVVGLSVFVSAIAQIGVTPEIQFNTGFESVLLIFIAFLLINLFALKMTSFKANSRISKYLLGFYLIFMIASIIILS